MSDKFETEVNKIQKNLENISLQTAKTGDIYFFFSDSLLNTNKKLDSLGKVVDSLTTQIEKSNTDFKKSTEVELAGWEIAVRYASKTIFEAVGAIALAPVMTPFWGGITGGVAYDGFQGWLDSILRPDPNKKPYDSTSQGDRSRASYYDAEEKKIRFEKVQKLNYSDDWSNSQKFAGNFIGRQIEYFNNQLVNPPKQQKTGRRKKRSYSKSQNTSYQNPFNDFVLQLQAFLVLIQQRFDEADFTKKLEERTNITADALGNLSNKINAELTDDYVTPGRRYSIDSDHYKIKPKYPKGESAELQFDAHGKAFAKSDPDKKDKASSAKQPKGPNPVEVFHKSFGEAQRLGGALNTIMKNLNIGSHTFVGGLINGFNDALSVVQSVVETIKALQTIGSVLSFLPFASGGSVPGFGDTDSVPAVLTPGEFVVKKSVVNKFGTGFLSGLTAADLQIR